MELHIKNLLRDALAKWKKWIECVKTGDMLDFMKAQKLKHVLHGNPRRILRDGYQRI